MRSVARLLVLAAVGAALVEVARAGGSRDLADAWLVDPDDVVAAGPASWRVDIGTGRLFNLADLPQWRLEVRAAGATWQAGLAWERLGRGLLGEDGVRVRAGLGRRWTLGLEGGADRLSVATGEPCLWPALALRAGGSLAPGLRLDVWCHLHDAPPWYGVGGLRRVALLTGRGEGYAWGAAIDRAADGRPSVQGEVLVRAAPGACLGVRFDPWSGAVGLSTAWRVRVGWLRTSHLVHPELGTTHRWALAVGVGAGSRP